MNGRKCRCGDVKVKLTNGSDHESMTTHLWRLCRNHRTFNLPFHLHSYHIYLAMAPSRAVLRSASTAFAALRTSSRTLASAAPAARQLHHISTTSRTLLPRNTLCATFTITPTRRFNSSDASADAASAVEAPDYLDEKELHIFQKLAAELSPTKLEVRIVYLRDSLNVRKSIGG